MRSLTSIPNITSPTGEYPVGRIRNDNSPIEEGTPVMEELYGDIIQVIHKLMRLAGITYNTLPENETSGFQLIDALQYLIRNTPASVNVKGVVELANDPETQAGLDGSRAITPAGLESKKATEIQYGISKIATLQENIDGTYTTDVVTPEFARKAARLYNLTINTDGIYLIGDQFGFVIINSINVVVRMPQPNNNRQGHQIRIFNNSAGPSLIQTYNGGIQYPTNLPSNYYIVFEYYFLSSEWICVYNQPIP